MASTARKTRVLWLVKGLGPGGAEVLLVSTARVADMSRFHFEAAYVLPWKDKLVPRLEALGVATHCLGRRTADLRWLLALRRLLVRGHYDVVHLHSPLVAGVARLVIRTLPSGRRPAVVSTEHNTWSSFALPTRLLNALLFRTDAKRFAVSEDVRQSVWPSLRRDVETLVHGVVLDDAVTSRSRRADVRRQLAIGDDDVLIATVANYRAQKAYPDLLVAAATVVAQQPRARFIAVGQGPLEAEITARHAELGLGDRFELLGYRADVVDLLSASDVFTLASVHEGFPIALMEALVAGVPVVATSVGGIPDAVVSGVNGLLVPPGQPAALASALLEMVSDDDLRAACAQGALVTGADFDIRNAVRHLEATYEQVARQAG